ncbi:hypothetical protein GALL_477750 [mine drainage metagenome]|uniref:Uncharacterized protein n=1 Tax=mine drainage metagenome TaxID=410659 RepID=A0A1J5PZA6_9ZZZZ
MVESVNGMPNFLAAWAALISPSAHCIPVSPVGARATGMLTAWPIMVLAVLRFSILMATRWRSLMRWKSSELAR